MTRAEIEEIEKRVTLTEENKRITIAFTPNIVLHDNATYTDESMMRAHLANYLKRLARHFEA